jgi:2-dehydro-3-deoxyphosphogluconate aldolase / (4S)-4-hydroxy-2-oxoglutarate aldolase
MSALDRIRAERLVAIVRRARDVDAVVEQLAVAGVGVVEITLDTPGALDAIARHAGRGLCILAGTVRSAADVDAAADAGAEACVSPALVPAAVARSLERGVVPIPGALTPTEIEAAWHAGAGCVKLFPSRLGGPGYLRDVLAPLGDVPLVATGGVDSSNAAEFLRAGAIAVAVGSSLTGAGDVAGEARRLLEAVSSVAPAA